MKVKSSLNDLTLLYLRCFDICSCRLRSYKMTFLSYAVKPIGSYFYSCSDVLKIPSSELQFKTTNIETLYAVDSVYYMCIDAILQEISNANNRKTPETPGSEVVMGPDVFRVCTILHQVLQFVRCLDNVHMNKFESIVRSIPGQLRERLWSDEHCDVFIVITNKGIGLYDFKEIVYSKILKCMHVVKDSSNGLFPQYEVSERMTCTYTVLNVLWALDDINEHICYDVLKVKKVFLNWKECRESRVKPILAKLYSVTLPEAPTEPAASIIFKYSTQCLDGRSVTVNDVEEFLDFTKCDNDTIWHVTCFTTCIEAIASEMKNGYCHVDNKDMRVLFRNLCMVMIKIRRNIQRGCVNGDGPMVREMLTDPLFECFSDPDECLPIVAIGSEEICFYRLSHLRYTEPDGHFHLAGLNDVRLYTSEVAMTYNFFWTECPRQAVVLSDIGTLGDIFQRNVNLCFNLYKAMGNDESKFKRNKLRPA